ncbi:HTH-type transcriptional regulator/antitoxin HipB [Paraburkholderia sp. WC7.3g]|uniref:Helix-turn-helix transcriptional regulator n=1 Tax=Paraburkholderia podalyriae TaxID=1938811 RepID=A0ABR7PMK3_9BURK|nr:helix-turn-helix transcriptional regulator [Paraburkholderia podalyriae]MBC8747612.1 helix-turn-helix transcriptional regulator [Paraburkholderia podalyriae]
MDYAIKTLSQLRPILQGFRKAAALTQAAMAAHLGVTQQTYAQLEANPAAVSVERLFRVLRVLQVDLKLTQSEPAQSVATEDVAPPPNRTRSRRAEPQASGTGAKAATPTRAARKPNAVKPVKVTKAASTSKKREDW